jgi:hypothetical protein
MQLTRHATVLSTLLLAAAPALAADGLFTSEASFVAAAGTTSIESFEALAGSGRSLAPIVTPGFTITSGGAPMGVQTAPDAPSSGFGGAATDGTNWVSVYLPNQPQGSITFTLASPALSFGLNLSDIAEASGTVVLTTNAGAFAGGVTLLSFPPLVNGGTVAFVGLTQDTPFNNVTLTISGFDEAYGVDKVYAGAVPEPTPVLTLLAGLAAIAGLVKRRSA